jgi:Leucine-rich repeat (LRR) protein
MNQLPNLQELYLNNNEITKIENLDKLTNLQKLYSNNNETIHDKIEKLKTLTSFNDMIDLHELILKKNKE